MIITKEEYTHNTLIQEQLPLRTLFIIISLSAGMLLAPQPQPILCPQTNRIWEQERESNGRKVHLSFFVCSIPLLDLAFTTWH